MWAYWVQKWFDFDSFKSFTPKKLLSPFLLLVALLFGFGCCCWCWYNCCCRCRRSTAESRGKIWWSVWRMNLKIISGSNRKRIIFFIFYFLLCFLFFVLHIWIGRISILDACCYETLWNWMYMPCAETNIFVNRSLSNKKWTLTSPLTVSMDFKSIFGSIAYHSSNECIPCSFVFRLYYILYLLMVFTVQDGFVHLNYMLCKCAETLSDFPVLSIQGHLLCCVLFFVQMQSIPVISPTQNVKSSVLSHGFIVIAHIHILCDFCKIFRLFIVTV